MAIHFGITFKLPQVENRCISESLSNISSNWRVEFKAKHCFLAHHGLLILLPQIIGPLFVKPPTKLYEGILRGGKSQ